DPYSSNRKTLSASACIRCVGIVENETFSGQPLLMIERDAAQIDGALAVQENFAVAVVNNDVAFLLHIELKLVAVSRATPALHTQAQTQVWPALGGDQAFDLFLRGRSKIDDLVAARNWRGRVGFLLRRRSGLR